MNPGERNVVVLSVILLLLLVALFVLYKKLNSETNGEYTVRRIVYKEGGLRDQVRGVAVAVGTRLGVQLWPGSDGEEDGEEMQEVQDEEEQVDRGGSEESDTDGDEEEEEDDDLEQSSKAKEKGSNSSNDNSSIARSEAGEQDKLTDETEAKDETKEKSEGKEEKVGEEQGKAETSRGPGLLIDLKQFSGSAIWSEEGGGESKGDVTAL